MREIAFSFHHQQVPLTGILHKPEQEPTRAVLMIVGGPQYRVGSHRHFVQYARALAHEGYAVMRFDYRGMGDSGGPFLEFEQVASDIHCAIEELLRRTPTVKNIYCFGLCDAASAALMFATQHTQVVGLILLNPWVRNEQTEAQTVIKHYYGKRLFEREFWAKLFRGGISPLGVAKEIIGHFLLGRSQKTMPKDFRDYMLEGAEKFRGPILLVMSGNDLTAREFEQLVKNSPRWRAVTSNENWKWCLVPEANHTFAHSTWKKQVLDISVGWLESKN